MIYFQKHFSLYDSNYLIFRIVMEGWEWVWLFVSKSVFRLHIFIQMGVRQWECGVLLIYFEPNLVFCRNLCLSSLILHNMIPHFVWLPHSQETFFNNSCKSWFLKELIQAFLSFIIIDLLQQNMSLSFPSGSTPKQPVPGKRQPLRV